MAVIEKFPTFRFKRSFLNRSLIKYNIKRLIVQVLKQVYKV